MKKALLCITILFSSLSFTDVNATQMTQEEMMRQLRELQAIVNNIEYPTQWSDSRFSQYLAEVYMKNYHTFNKEFGDGEKSKFVQKRNKFLKVLGTLINEETDIGIDVGRKYAVRQLKENPDILKSDPHTWANQGIAEAEKHLKIANRLSGLIFGKYFNGKPSITLT